ncbi:MAG: hypothetical protein HY872_07805 [Chloroflexi bacterium]|nr:hypothetical protein [Chloroflexota bacterium]
MDRIKRIIRDNGGLFVALAVAAALKAALLAMNVVPFNADEAVVALMARHILQGERPVFFYGQAYLGSLDAWLIAGAFALFGPSVAAARVVQSLLYLGTIATTYALGLKIFADRWAATAAALLLAIPTVLVTLYTTATLGGYGETLLIGNGLLLWAVRLRGSAGATPGVRSTVEWLLFGALAGFGFWGFGLLGVYLLPIAVALIAPNSYREDTKGAKFLLVFLRVLRAFAVKHLSAIIGFALGSAPWWWAAASGGAAALSELGGSAIAGASAHGPLGNIALHLFSLVVLGLPVIAGLRPPWGVTWLALPLWPLALPLFFGAAGWAAHVARRDWKKAMLFGVGLTALGAFVLTPFGADPSGRYFLPLAAPLALFTGDLLRRVWSERPRWAIALLAGLIVFNLWGTLQSARAFPPGLTTQFDAVAQVDQRDLPAVIDFLRTHGETRGYTNYWVEFPMAFLSNEQLLYSAALPYHPNFSYTRRDDRYPPYAAAVAASSRAAYVTTRHPALDDRLRAQFPALGVTFSETTLGDFHIFYGLSRKVTPAELDLSPQP